MSNTTKTDNNTFSVKRFIVSSLGYFVIFSALIGIFYLTDPNMLEYNFLFISSAVVALVLGFYHGKYKEQKDIDTAVDADVAHVEEAVEEEIEEIEKKLHLK